MSANKRKNQDPYYKNLEDTTLNTLGAATTGFAACNVEVCETILNHIRECYCIFSEETVDTADVLAPPKSEKAEQMDEE